MKIVNITYPWIFTDDGQRLHATRFEDKNSIFNGVTIELNEETGKYFVVGKDVDPDCVGGVCSLPLPDNK